MLGRPKNWRRVATRYDRCPKVFLSVIALAALIIYWLRILTLKLRNNVEEHTFIIKGQIAKVTPTTLSDLDNSILPPLPTGLCPSNFST